MWKLTLTLRHISALFLSLLLLSSIFDNNIIRNNNNNNNSYNNNLIDPPNIDDSVANRQLYSKLN